MPFQRGEPPQPTPRDIVLHIGSRKTGTSSIQFFLRDNRERLAEIDCLYPQTPGRARHVRLGLLAKTRRELASSPEWYRQKQTHPARFRKDFRRRLLSEIERSRLSRVLFSDEAVFGSSDRALRRLRGFIDRMSRSVRLVVYLRRQDDHLISCYQQEVKTGETLRLKEWARQDMSRIYDYDACLRRHERLLAPTEFVVRRFERDAFADGSLYQDFLAAAGIDAPADEFAQVEPRNESLDAESVEFLRLLNLCRVETEAATPGLIDNRRLVTRLTEGTGGPTVTMPAPFLDDFMAQWEEPNRRVAREFLGEPSGQLFRLPRKSGNTTTDQRLDPGRLDHFLALSQLPEQIHATLRALAEREAKNP